MEKIFNSDSIERNFSKKALSYDSNAFIQKIISKNIFDLINKMNKNYEVIFEIGCGTGFLTEFLLKLPTKLLIVNDISSKMLETLSKKIYYDKIVYINSDFLKINDTIKNDLICSNAVFQWIRDLDFLFHKVNTLLTHNGIFAFSIFIDGTFKELNQAFNNAYLLKGYTPQKHTLDFYTKDHIKKILIKNHFDILEFYSYKYKMFYDTPNDFLKSVHNIGATLNTKEKVKYSIIKKMLEEYKRLFTTTQHKTYATYNVLFVIAKKR